MARPLQPYIFVGPAILLLADSCSMPALVTLYQSLFDRQLHQLCRPPELSRRLHRQPSAGSRSATTYLAVGRAPALCVIFGLLIAVLADRSRFETLAKALIFLPMAISFVGAGVIWRFVYAYAPPGQPQIGLLNAIAVAFGGQPAILAHRQPWDTFFLIAVLVWIQTGFAMVLFSAALKGVPAELIEAARLDGASEIQIFFQIIIPYIQGTIITVTTTTAIFTLKIFDVVIVMTGGQYGTESSRPSSTASSSPTATSATGPRSPSCC